MTALNRYRMPISPAGWQLCMSAYAATLGIAWMFSPQIFNAETYHILKELCPYPQIWATILLGYAGFNCWYLIGSIRPPKAMMAMVGAIMWLMLGFMMMVSARFQAVVPFWSPSGMFELLGCVGCLVSALQWSDHIALLQEQITSEETPLPAYKLRSWEDPVI